MDSRVVWGCRAGKGVLSQPFPYHMMCPADVAAPPLGALIGTGAVSLPPALAPVALAAAPAVAPPLPAAGVTGAAPEAAPEIAPVAAPEVAPVAAPVAAPEAAPAAAPEVAPTVGKHCGTDKARLPESGDMTSASAHRSGFPVSGCWS